MSLLVRVFLHPQHVVLIVREHVEHKSDANGAKPPRPMQALIGEHTENDIDSNGIVRVKGVEADAHAVRVEERVSQQVVGIDNHRTQHDEECFPTALFSEEDKGQQQGSHEVQPVMRNGSPRNCL